MEPDELHVKAALSGDKDAFRKIVEKYQALIYKVCYNIAKEHQEAENLSQEAFIQAYKTLSQYQNRGFKTWLTRIAVNKSIDWKRKMSAKNISNVIYIEDIMENSLSQDTVQDSIIIKDERNRVMDLCKKLPQKYGRVMIKYYFHSKNYVQISKEEGISVRTVESRLYRAKQMFKKHWKDGERNAAL